MTHRIADNTTAVIVTRGDVSLDPVLDTLTPIFGDRIVIWDNSTRDRDLKVYGHFEAFAEVETDYVLTQDDDAICPIPELFAAWDPKLHADRILLNEADGETPWISWGAIFHRDLPAPAIDRYVAAYGWSDDVLLWCDMIFSTLTPWTNVDLGRVSLPHASAPDRMWMQPGHYQEQVRVKALAEALL